MVVRTAPEGHRHLVPLELSGRGGHPVDEPIRITPRRIDFGDVPIGGSVPSQAVLLRAPDAAGRDYWAPRVIREGDVALAISLASSPEFLTLAQTYYEGA